MRGRERDEANDEHTMTALVAERPRATACCDWAYFPSDWPEGPGPIVALLKHWREAHGGVPEAMVADAALVRRA